MDVATHAAVFAFSTFWVQPFMKSTCSVSVDPAMVGVMDSVRPFALDVGYTTWNTICGMTTGCDAGHPAAVGYTTLVCPTALSVWPSQQLGNVTISRSLDVPGQSCGVAVPLAGNGFALVAVQVQRITDVGWGAVAVSSPAMICSPAGGAWTAGASDLTCRQ